MAFPLYKDLTKKQTDLLNEHYGFTNPLAFKLKTVEKTPGAHKTTYQLKLNQSESRTALDGEKSLKIEEGACTFEAKGKLSNDYSFQVDYVPESKPDAKIIALSKAKINGEGQCNHSNELGMEYKFANGNVKADYRHNSNPNFEASLVTGKGKFAAGFQTVFNLNRSRFVLYNAALYHYCAQANQILALKHESVNSDGYTLGRLIGSYYKVLNDNLTLGGQVTHDAGSNSTQLTLGGQYKVSDQSVLKGRLNSDAQFSTVFRHKVNNNITISLAHDIDTSKIHETKSVNDFDLRQGLAFEFQY